MFHKMSEESNVELMKSFNEERRRVNTELAMIIKDGMTEMNMNLDARLSANYERRFNIFVERILYHINNIPEKELICI